MCQFSLQSENIPVFLFQLREIYVFLRVCIEITNFRQNCLTFLFSTCLDYLQLSTTQTGHEQSLFDARHENSFFSCRA